MTKSGAIVEQACLESHPLIASPSILCMRRTCKLAVYCAEKDEEGAKLLEAVNVVTAKTGTTVTLSE